VPGFVPAERQLEKHTFAATPSGSRVDEAEIHRVGHNLSKFRLRGPVWLFEKAAS
jgi:hypothetical protein